MQLLNSVMRTQRYEQRENWARNVAQQLQAKQDEANRAAAENTTNRKIVSHDMPQVWEKLCKEFQEHCDEFNEEAKPDRKLGFHMLGVHDFIVRPDALPEIVTGHYSAQSQRIGITTKEGTDWYAPQIVHVGGGAIQLASESTGRSVNLSSIAQKAISDSVL